MATYHLVWSYIARIASYRAGYSKDIRREIEKNFFSGNLLGLVATNALELGIDVGDLQCTIHLGIPRQLSSLWQQMGRGGRGYETDSIAIVITLPISGVDAYYMEHPDEFFSKRDPVCALFVPPDVTRDHLFCAMSEYPGPVEDYLQLFWEEKKFRKEERPAQLQEQAHPLEAPEQELPSTSLIPLVSFHDIQQEFPYRFYFDPKTSVVEYCAPPKEKNAHARFNIREIETQYQVWDANDYSSTAAPLDTLEESVAYVKLYRGAIYRIQRETYIVEDLDTTNQWAVVRKHVGEPLKYYTRAKDRVEVVIHNAMKEVLGEIEVNKGAGARTAAASYIRIFDQLHTLYRGPLTTFLFVTGYHKLNKADGQVEDTIDLKMAPLKPGPTIKRYHTGIWLELGALAQLHPHGLHALEHVMALLAPVFGVTEALKAQHNRGMKKGAGEGASGENDHGTKLLLYPYSKTLAENFGNLIECAAERIFTCDCVKGCPKCIFDSSCYQGGLCKEDAKSLLLKLGYGEGQQGALGRKVVPDMRVETITRSMA
eukprot:g10033.t1